MAGKERAVEGVAGDLQERVADPAVASQQRRLDAEKACLLGDERDLGVVTWNEYRVRLGGLDGGELRLEVFVACRSFCSFTICPPLALKSLIKNSARPTL